MGKKNQFFIDFKILKGIERRPRDTLDSFNFCPTVLKMRLLVVLFFECQTFLLCMNSEGCNRSKLFLSLVLHVFSPPFLNLNMMLLRCISDFSLGS